MGEDDLKFAVVLVSSWVLVHSLVKATCAAEVAVTRMGVTVSRQTARRSLSETASEQSGQPGTLPASSLAAWKRSAHGRQSTWPQP